MQRRSPAAAAKVLGDFVANNPNSREARLNYARVLVLDKRLPEARKQFEAVLAANPGNTEVIYAVGLLAFQLKDFPIAEENMKRLLTLGYRTRTEALLAGRSGGGGEGLQQACSGDRITTGY